MHITLPARTPGNCVRVGSAGAAQGNASCWCCLAAVVLEAPQSAGTSTCSASCSPPARAMSLLPAAAAAQAGAEASAASLSLDNSCCCCCKCACAGRNHGLPSPLLSHEKAACVGAVDKTTKKRTCQWADDAVADDCCCLQQLSGAARKLDRF